MKRVCVLLAVLLPVLVGCVGSNSTQLHCPRDPATGMSQCTMSSSSPGDAIGVTALAAGVYAGKGCTVNGCLLPDRCNPKTKRCEPIHCSEAQSCPAGYSCDLETTLCR
jgi:hypothetical protein